MPIRKYKIEYLFFIIFLLVGILIFKDYGLSTDEKHNLKKGFTSIKYASKLLGSDIKLDHANQFKWLPDLKEDKSRFHGPAFEILLAGIGIVAKIEDSRNLYLTRHFLTFLAFWISTVFFYLIILKTFNSRWLGILGCMFLILSPRIFAHSFYNSKDLAFMSFCIIAVYTLLRFIDNKNFKNAIAHALICGFLVDIRIVGIYIPFLTIFFFYADNLLNKQLDIKNILYTPAVYVLSLILFIYIFWPFLWEDPINNFISSFINMKKFNLWDNEILFFGKIINMNKLPWYYVPTWILITTPLLYSILFFMGLIFCSLTILLKLRVLQTKNQESYILIFILLFFSPLVAVIMFKSVLYSGWRHMYFIYPPFILIAMAGFYYLINSKLSISLSYKFTPKLIIMLLAALSIINTSWQMIKYHPHQNVYFNFLAGKKVLGKFDMDYWGLSYKQLYEYILSNSSKTRIYVTNTNKKPARLNHMILDKESRKRIILVQDAKKADYFLTAYRRKRHVHRSELNQKPYTNEIYSISLDSKKIASVFQPNKVK